MTDTRCHCTRHTPTPQTTACTRYQAMNTAHLFPVLAAIARDYNALCERGSVPQIPTAVGAMPLTDLAAYLTCPLTDDGERDAVWRHIIEHCRCSGPEAEAWKRAVLGLALPRLIHIALRARERNHIRPTETDEMVAEMLAAFTHALATIDPAPDTADPITWRLARAAAAGAQKAADRRAAHRRRVTENDDNLPEPGHLHPHPPEPPGPRPRPARRRRHHQSPGSRPHRTAPDRARHPPTPVHRTRLVPHAGHPRPTRRRNQSRPRTPRRDAALTRTAPYATRRGETAASLWVAVRRRLPVPCQGTDPRRRTGRERGAGDATPMSWKATDARGMGMGADIGVRLEELEQARASLANLLTDVFEDAGSPTNPTTVRSNTASNGGTGQMPGDVMRPADAGGSSFGPTGQGIAQISALTSAHNKAQDALIALLGDLNTQISAIHERVDKTHQAYAATEAELHVSINRTQEVA